MIALPYLKSLNIKKTPGDPFSEYNLVIMAKRPLPSPWFGTSAFSKVAYFEIVIICSLILLQ